MSKTFKKLATLGIASWLALQPVKAGAESKIQSFLSKLECAVSAGMQFNTKSPAQSYIDSVNQIFEEGNIIAPKMIGWKNISVSNPSEMPIEVSVLYKPNSKIKAGLIGAISGAKAESRYNESYNSVLGNPYVFDRKEDIEMNSNSIGIKAGVALADWLAVSLAAKQDNYKIKGNVDYQMDRIDTGYTQWRDAEYSGSGSGNSLELEGDFKINKNLSVGVSAGSRSGKVKTNGQYVRTQSTNPGQSWTYDYNPEFDRNSSYVGLNAEIKF